MFFSEKRGDDERANGAREEQTKPATRVTTKARACRRMRERASAHSLPNHFPGPETQRRDAIRSTADHREGTIEETQGPWRPGRSGGKPRRTSGGEERALRERHRDEMRRFHGNTKTLVAGETARADELRRGREENVRRGLFREHDSAGKQSSIRRQLFRGEATGERAGGGVCLYRQKI